MSGIFGISQNIMYPINNNILLQNAINNLLFAGMFYVLMQV